MKGFIIIIAANLLFAMIQIMPAAGSDTIRVGVQIPLTGDAAGIGRDIHRGIRLIARKINDQGGIQGKTIELFTCDDQGSTLGAVICAKDFINKGVTAVIGSSDRASTQAAGESYCKKGILQMGRGAAEPLMPNYCHTFLNLPAGNETLAAYTANFMIKVKAYRNIILISDTITAQREQAAAVEAEISKLGGVAALREILNPGDLNYLPLLKEIKSRHPDTVFFCGKDRDAAPLKILMNQVGIQADFLFIGHGGHPEFHQAAGDYAQDAYCIAMAPPEILPYDLTAEFLYDFKSAYNMASPAIQALIYIDGARALFHALRETQSEDPMILADQLHAMENFPALSGPFSFSQPISRIGNSYLTWKYNRDGSKEIVDPVFEKKAMGRVEALLKTDAAPSIP